jgi:Ala-tRNA(Pro) deacylase
MAVMSESVFQRVEALLRGHHVSFEVMRHAPVYTSEEAARVRGTPLASGAKALVCKGDDAVVMFVVPADRRLDSKAIRQSRGWRKLRFVTRDEVFKITGLEPGSIPPFGSLFGLPTFCDTRLGLNEKINFNAGDHSISVSMRYADYLRVESPELGTFAE